MYYDSTVCCHLPWSEVKVNVKVRDQPEVKTNTWRVAVDIRGSACRVKQRVITLRFGTRNDYYQSEEFVCVFVLRGIYADYPVDAVERLLILRRLYMVKGKLLHTILYNKQYRRKTDIKGCMQWIFVQTCLNLKSYLCMLHAYTDNSKSI